MEFFNTFAYVSGESDRIFVKIITDVASDMDVLNTFRNSSGSWLRIRTLDTDSRCGLRTLDTFVLLF